MAPEKKSGGRDRRRRMGEDPLAAITGYGRQTTSVEDSARSTQDAGHGEEEDWTDLTEGGSTEENAPESSLRESSQEPEPESAGGSIESEDPPPSSGVKQAADVGTGSATDRREDVPQTSVSRERESGGVPGYEWQRPPGPEADRDYDHTGGDPGAEEYAESRQGSIRKVRVSFMLERELVEEARDAAHWLPGYTLTGIVREGLRAELQRLVEEYNSGERFASRSEPLRRGRPISR